jgi:hypothetical protein
MKSAVTFTLLFSALASTVEAIKLPHFGRIDANDNDLVQRVLKQEYTHVVVGGGTCEFLSFSFRLPRMEKKC